MERGALVTVVTVNWNSGPLLKRCIESVRASDAASVDRFIVVDNASVDGSAEGLGEGPFETIVLRNSTNRGFAAACNQGAQLARGRYVLFLNPDTQTHPGAIAAALEFLARPENTAFAVCGAQLVSPEGFVQRSCARLPRVSNLLYTSLGLSHISPRAFPGVVMSEWPHDTSREVPHVIGAFFLVRTAVFRELGGFDEGFFVYLEDLDFSRRLKAQGFLSYYLASAKVTHVGGGTSRQVPALRLFYALSSRLYYSRKHLPRWQASLVTFATIVIEPFVRVLRLLLSLDLNAIAATCAAYRLLVTRGAGTGERALDIPS